MKLILLAAVLFASFAGVSAQTPDNKPVGISELYMAKDDGNGSYGDAVESFAVTDLPIYCVVQLDSFKAAKVAMYFVAVDVKGVKPESRIITVNFATDGNQSLVYFRGKPKSGNWFPGNYRVDIYVDDKLAGSKAFPIVGPQPAPAPQKSNFVTPAPKSQPKPRRNKKP